LFYTPLQRRKAREEHNKDMLIAAARVKEMAAQKRISTAALLPDIKGKATSATIVIRSARCASIDCRYSAILAERAQRRFPQYKRKSNS